MSVENENVDVVQSEEVVETTNENNVSDEIKPDEKVEVSGESQVEEKSEEKKEEKPTENIEVSAEVNDEVQTEESKVAMPEESKKTEPEESKVESSDKEIPVLSEAEKNEIEQELKAKNESGESLKVDFHDNTIGGFRVLYKNYTLFLPISHISSKKNPNKSEIEELKKESFEVKIQDIKELNGTTTYVVSRKKFLEAKVWDSIKIGDEVEGRVSSIPQFGVFLDLGGAEGLIHISKLAKGRVSKATDFCKKGDVLKARIIDIDKENRKISLSHEEYTESPWDNVEEKYPVGSKQVAVVRDIKHYGAYLDLDKNISGLLRNNELSWTKRYSEPNQLLKKGQKLEVVIKDLNKEKENIDLSVKDLKENPWNDIKERYPIDSVYFAKVTQVNPKGVIFELNEEVDGFMPKSKITSIKRNAAIPYKVGESIEVKIAEIVPENESVILKPNAEEVPQFNDRPEKIDNKFKKSSKSNGISLGDLLSDAIKTDLNKIG